MSNFLLIFICLGAGMLLQRRRDMPESAALALNLYVIYMALPALVLAQMPKLTFSTDLLVPIVMPWAMLAVGAFLVLLGRRLFHWSREVTGCLLLCVPLGNTSFLGIPMVTAFFGADMVPYAVIYDQLGSFIALSTYGTLVLASYQEGSRPQLKAIVTKIVTFPPFLALVLAFALLPYDYPAALAATLERIGASLVPVVMVAVGLQLKIRLPGPYVVPFGHGLLVKLVVAPLLALFACKALGLESDAARIAVFEAGMPPMVTAGALALAAGLATELAAALVGWGIVISFVTLSGLYWLM
ncbi:MAG: hypothetical protein C0613_16110 [Desulfobulbaceae bacterium]|nr:MAG: hypothetical protein C0613_16110 [Desulfobulbaceae bacterium]